MGEALHICMQLLCFNRKMQSDNCSITSQFDPTQIFFLQIDEHALTDKRYQLGKDPFPIYTVTDKQSKQEKGGLCLSVIIQVLLCSCLLLYVGVFCLQTPGLRSLHMKQVIPSLERLWKPPASAASLTTAQRKNTSLKWTCFTCKVCHMSLLIFAV